MSSHLTSTYLVSPLHHNYNPLSQAQEIDSIVRVPCHTISVFDPYLPSMSNGIHDITSDPHISEKEQRWEVLRYEGVTCSGSHYLELPEFVYHLTPQYVHLVYESSY